MRRVIALMAVVVVACSQRAVQPSSSLVGARDMVQVGQLLFVTSSERSQLRALDLEPGPLVTQPRQYVPAPNPLEPLAIPVLKRPTMLSADVSWSTDGVEVHGPLVYAGSNGSAELSIVGGGRSLLVELVRLPANGPITAVAGFYDGTNSQLYFATFDGAQAQLQTLTLPPPTQLPALPVEDLVKQVRVLARLPAKVISDLIVLPNGRLAFAERTALGAGGGTFVLELSDLSLREMKFDSPVRSLATNGRVSDALREGDRLYGILDEEFCGSTSCSGVQAVDTDGGQVSLDSTGHPMVPITFGTGLPISLSLAPGAELNSPVDGGYRVQQRQILGVTSVTNGSIVYWEAGGLTPIDTNPNAAAVIAGAFYDSAGNAVDNTLMPPGPFFYDAGAVDYSPIKLGDGATRDEGIAVVVEGQIPGLVDLPYDGGAQLLVGAAASRAAVGDAVLFSDGTGATCAEGQVTGVSALTIDFGPQSCGATATVRAGASQPYVVTGTISGYFGRGAPGQTSSFAGSYFFHPPTFDPSVPQLAISFGAATGLSRDSKWLFTVDDAYLPYVTQIDSTSAGCAATFPGTVVTDGARARTFTAFPSANAIIETNNVVVTRSILTSSIFCYR